MKRIFYRSLATIGIMSLAYYLYNSRKYNKAAKKVTTNVRNSLKNAGA